MADVQNSQAAVAGFEDAPTREKIELPADLPNAREALNAGRKAGQGYRSNDGYLYRLVEASWRRDSRADRKPVATEPTPSAAPARK